MYLSWKTNYIIVDKIVLYSFLELSPAFAGLMLTRSVTIVGYFAHGVKEIGRAHNSVRLILTIFYHSLH